MQQLLRVETRVPVPRWDLTSLSLKPPFVTQSPIHGFQTLPTNGPKCKGPFPLSLSLWHSQCLQSHLAPPHRLPWRQLLETERE